MRTYNCTRAAQEPKPKYIPHLDTTQTSVLQVLVMTLALVTGEETPSLGLTTSISKAVGWNI